MRRQVLARGSFTLTAVFIVCGLRDHARKQHADTGSNNERGSHNFILLLMVNPVRVQGHPKTAGCRGKRIFSPAYGHSCAGPAGMITDLATTLYLDRKRARWLANFGRSRFDCCREGL